MHSSALATLTSGLVWHGRQLAGHAGPVLPSGYPPLDAELPGGGWPGAAITELLFDAEGIGELSLLLPLMRKNAVERWQIWINPPRLPYAPALQTAGIDLDRLLLISPPAVTDALWATRQALGSGSCTMVLAWLPHIDNAGLRRLQLAAETGATPLFLFRKLASARQPSPAPLRLALAAHGGELRIDILKRRGPLAHAPVFLPLSRVKP